MYVTDTQRDFVAFVPSCLTALKQLPSSEDLDEAFGVHTFSGF